MKKCLVDNCNKLVREGYNKEIYCPMHRTRLLRHNSLDRHIIRGSQSLPFNEIVNKLIVDNQNILKDKELAKLLIDSGYPNIKSYQIKHRRYKLDIKKYSNEGKHSSKNRARIAYGKKCEICTFELTTDVHHVVEKKNGGSNHINNLCILCPNCHCLIHRKILSQPTCREDLLKLKIELTSLTCNNA